MANVSVSESINAPAERVWDLLGDFGGVGRWGGTLVESCTVEGDGAGAVRTVRLQGGTAIQERCEALDEDGRALTYSIVGASPIPIRDYLATCRVVATGPNTCRVDWTGRFEPDGVPVDQAQDMVRMIYLNAITEIRKLVAA